METIKNWFASPISSSIAMSKGLASAIIGTVAFVVIVFVSGSSKCTIKQK